ncbi:UNVERIFIED_CONTAM: hypothetical protein HDU68_002541, partial [Siphonaria sp. JEL0065]
MKPLLNNSLRNIFRRKANSNSVDSEKGTSRGSPAIKPDDSSNSNSSSNGSVTSDSLLQLRSVPDGSHIVSTLAHNDSLGNHVTPPLNLSLTLNLGLDHVPEVSTPSPTTLSLSRGSTTLRPKSLAPAPARPRSRNGVAQRPVSMSVATDLRPSLGLSAPFVQSDDRSSVSSTSSLRRSVTMARPPVRHVPPKMVPLSRGKSDAEIDVEEPCDISAGKSLSRLSLAQSISDLKQTAEHLKSAFVKLVNYDKVIRIAAPGVAGSEHEGPWSDSFTPSPIPPWKLNPETMTDKTSLHVMTVGRPYIDPDTGEELRRVKVYEHHIAIPNVDEIAKRLVTDPADALTIVDSILRSPYTKCKLTDKMLTKQSAIAALSMAQINLLPLFGVWLNSLLCPETDVKASTPN